MHRVALPRRWAQVAFLSSSLLVTQNSRAYDCLSADVIVAVDASESISLENVRNRAIATLEELATFSRGRREFDVQLLSAIVFSTSVEHSSEAWPGEGAHARARSLFEAIPNLKFRSRGTLLAPMLRYAHAKFSERRESGRRPILIVLTDGKGEAWNYRESFFMGGGVKYRPANEAIVRWQREEGLDQLNAYRRALRRFYAFRDEYAREAASIAIPVSPAWSASARDPRTLGELTSDQIENLPRLSQMLPRLLICQA